ncbi:LytTR family DNA-binding domain-containing protein [Pedobacter frigidisoli]|uniref:LytR/AlgR family response regulator transcription factor n=1 Tax=Pedobacter frigidisoli TaxID=2530455 RepID=UPI00292E7C48|nr:LytTR family DNA-binding domain-containing protein [Pedobacter frigidisoli]
MKLNCIAVDDDAANLEILSDYIETLGNYTLLKSFTDPISAMHYIRKMDNLDIVFMDIEMPKMSGIELSRIIRSKTKHLILTTAHPKYALDAFEIDADDFLLKPFSLGKFAGVLNKLNSASAPVEPPAKAEDDEFFFIKSKNDKSRLVRIRFAEIVAIESIQNYVSIYTTNKTIVAHITLIKIKEILAKKNYFIQIHRSFVISKNYLEEIENNIIKMANDLRISVGDSYRDELTDFVKEKTVKTGRS